MADFDENGCPVSQGTMPPPELDPSYLLEMVDRFQLSCQEVLDSVQQCSLDNGMENSDLQSPYNYCSGADNGPQPPSSGNLDEVKQNLEKMLSVLEFESCNFIEDRNKHINALRDSLDLNMDWVDLARVKLEELNWTLKSGSQDLDCLVKKWRDKSEYFGDIHTALMDPNYPVPSLDEHPSVIVNQKTYSDLVFGFMSLCHKAEHHATLIKILYSSLEERVECANKEIENAYKNTSHFLELCNTALNENSKMERLFSEKEHAVRAFLQEWNKQYDVDRAENQNRPKYPPPSAEPNVVLLPQDKPQSRPEPPHSYPRGAPGAALSSMTSRSSAACLASLALRHLQPSSPPFSSSSSTACPAGGLSEGKPAVQEMVKEFKHIKDDVVNEISSIKDRNDILNQSVVAMKDLPPN